MASTPHNLSQWPPASSQSRTTPPKRKRNFEESLGEPSSHLTQTPREGRLFYTKPNLDDSAGPSISGDMTKLTHETEYSTQFSETQYETWPQERSDVEAQLMGDEMTAQTKTEAGPLPEPIRKARRLDTSSTHDSTTEIWKKSTTSLKSSPEGPAIDQFTHLLGVGWSRVGEDADVQAAARGWAKYVENHYPLSTARIMLKSKALDACLVETKEGYYLFQEDLSECRLVGLSWETCLAHLKSSPITFEGMETLKAADARTPDLIPSSSARDHFSSGSNPHASPSSPILSSSSPPTTPEFDEMLVD